MDYLIFVVVGLIATVLGYAFGWALNQWDTMERSADPIATLRILLVLVGTSLAILVGLVYLGMNLRVFSFVISPLLGLIGFRFGHPEWSDRIRNGLKTVSEIFSTLKN